MGMLGVLPCFLLSVCTTAYARPLDSVYTQTKPVLYKVPQYTAKEAFANNFSYMGLGFAAAGFLVKSQKKDFREMRHYFQPHFKKTFDNYTQYLPLAATWALNVAGVEGRSSLKRLAVSNALSAVAMASIVNGMKHSIREMRPDGTSRNSFPSGHTATAFVTAGILHKEYGLTRSPWYSVAGYAIATATGVGRILNNRHWISDVLVGAGVGILATDVGYLVSDLLFKEKGLRRSSLEALPPDITHRPHFWGLTVEMGVGPKQLNIPEVYDNYDAQMQPYAPSDSRGVSHALGLKMYMGTGSAVSTEGAYFFHPNIGVGGRLRAMSVPVTATVDLSKGFRYDVRRDGRIDEETAKYIHFVGVESNHIGMFDLGVGPYFTCLLNDRLRLGGKLLMGRRLTTDYRIDAIVDVDVDGLRRFYGPLDANDARYFDEPSQKQEIMDILDGLGDGKGMHESEFLTIRSNRSMVYGTGVSLTWAYKHGMSLKAQLNYDYSAPDYTFQLVNRWEEHADGTQSYITDTFTRKTHMHSLSLGLGMVLNF